ncbi:hypothetical protein [Lolliginicoccus levis]|uniref:hypothetical protein n=1 Tax=Lolliginicoccus levis TaxID=2919542 RepID=UPI00241CA3B2|nr:hypothetical protein [Lolliginicoccus levis]
MGRTVPVQDPLKARSAPSYDPTVPVLSCAAVVAYARAVGNPYITVRTVQHATTTGQLASSKVAGRRMYSEHNVRAWLRGDRA